MPARRGPNTVITPKAAPSGRVRWLPNSARISGGVALVATS